MGIPGEKIRALRLERLGLKTTDGKPYTVNGKKASKEFIALDAGVTSKAYTEIENGITRQPAREIIEAIINSLEKFKPLGMEDRFIILSEYGYKISIPLPIPQEIQHAREEWQQQQGNIWYPAYLVDIGQRLLDWNRYVPRLIGFQMSDPKLSQFRNITMFDVVFGLSPKYISIVNSDEYLPALIRTIQADYFPYQEEEWYQSMVAENKKKYPLFKKIWEEQPPVQSFNQFIGNEVPIIMQIPRVGILKFLLMRINFVSDIRFFTIQWMPVDEKTALQCLMWKKEEDEIGQ